jgi:hypothetical protein
MSLLSRDGISPADHEQGLRDTFVVGEMRTISVPVQTPTVSGSDRARRRPCVRVSGRVVLTKATSRGLMVTTVQANSLL